MEIFAADGEAKRIVSTIKFCTLYYLPINATLKRFFTRLVVVLGTKRGLTIIPTLDKSFPHFFNAHAQNTPSICHFEAIFTHFWLVPRALLTF